MRRDSLFTIAPDAPFLATLRDRVLDGTLLAGWDRSGPFWLSDVTIILPTRRARLVLAQLFAEAVGGGTSLLPDIRTFGGEVADEEPFLPPFDAPQTLRPAGSLERTLTLARLVAAWAATEQGRDVLANPPGAAEIFGFARSLGTVIDDLAIEGGALSRLDDEIGKLDLANNWQQTRQLLEIAADLWPKHLADHGKADPTMLRNDRLRRQASAAPLVYGDRPVIAAGSTGSVPATADLLAAILELPRGAVVLPGLDHTLSAESFAGLLDHGTQPHGHPQYIMAGLLRRLGTAPAAVVPLVNETPRTRLVRIALAPTEETAHWAEARAALAPVLSEALQGVAILAARNEDEEARAIAVAARAALAEGRSVGIVSPDQTLSRRIVEDLRRFDIEVDDAAGTPLFQSGAGRLLRLLLAAATSGFAPVDLMALLDNRATALGLGRAEVAATARILDVGVLRGERPGPGIAGVRDLVRRRASPDATRPLGPDELAALDRLLAALEAATLPLCQLLDRDAIDAASLAAAIGAAFEAVTAGSEPSALPEGTDMLRRWVGEMAELADHGPPFAARGLDAVLAALMAGLKVTATIPRCDDIAIWGRLEARLMNPDLMILAGLNEDIWPEPADPGPWLSRGMRLAAGLEPPERQHGQAAHDFEMGLGNREVLLAFSTRRGASPALPSRFLQRLEALIGEDEADKLRSRGGHWLSLARRLDLNPGPPVPATRPSPRPPLHLRPKQLSVTDIETLYRSPYDIHAKYVLGLRRMAALGEMPEGRERGTIVHDIFARFVIEGHDVASPKAESVLMTIAEQAFSGLDAIGERRDLWLGRFRHAACAFLEYEREREPRVLRRHAEIGAKAAFLNGFTLIGRADRIDEMRSGGFEILDYKTGGIPQKQAMQAYEAPQLLLESLLVRQGGFNNVAAWPPEALTYIKIGLGPEAFVPSPFRQEDGLSLDEATDRAGILLQALVEAWLLRDDRAMTARMRPASGQRYRGDYDHLARTDEWSVAAGDDE